MGHKIGSSMGYGSLRAKPEGGGAIFSGACSVTYIEKEGD